MPPRRIRRAMTVKRGRSMTAVMVGAAALAFPIKAEANKPSGLWTPPKPALIRATGDKLEAALPGLIAPVVSKPIPVLTWVTSNSSASDATSYTFNTQSIGAATFDRVVLATSISRSSADPGTPTCTIGGNSANLAASFENNIDSGWNSCGFFTLPVSSGTTANFVFGWSGATILRMSISIWIVTGGFANPATAFHTASDIDNSDPLTASVNLAANGFAIGVAANSTTSDWAWTNMTRRYNTVVEGTHCHSAADYTATTPETGRTITANPNQTAGTYGALFVASFR